MTSERRKAALDAILNRIHREGYRNYGGFAKRAAIWFEQHCGKGMIENNFIERFESGTDFHRYNEVEDRADFLEGLYAEAAEAIDVVPPAGPRQLYVDDIDTFQQVSKVTSDDVDMEQLEEISEADVKRYLRQIIGEPFDQQDWGGELNDLCTDVVKVDGRRVTTAFMLKGPSVSGSLQISDGGKRGDQFQRLFESPADLFVVQYNGKIEDRTKTHIDTLARDRNALLYCIINGTDTLRLLTAYGQI